MDPKLPELSAGDLASEDVAEKLAVILVAALTAGAIPHEVPHEKAAAHAFKRAEAFLEAAKAQGYSAKDVITSMALAR